MIERLWRTLKYDDIYSQEYTTITDLQKGLSSHFNYHTSEGKNSSRENKTPADVYRSGRSKRANFSI